jgi:Tripartite tricarboxylate transporter TctB family
MKPVSMSKWGTVLFHIFLLLVVFAMIASSLGLGRRARLLPLMIGLPTAVLLLLSLLRELKPDLVLRFQNRMAIFHNEATDNKTPSGFSSAVEQEVPPLRSFLIGGGWFCLLLVLVLFLGFPVATLIFVPSFLFIFARYSWWRVLLYTAVLFFVEWYGFEVLLGLKLWHGAAPEIVPGFLGGDILPPFF